MISIGSLEVGVIHVLASRRVKFPLEQTRTPVYESQSVDWDYPRMRTRRSLTFNLNDFDEMLLTVVNR